MLEQMLKRKGVELVTSTIQRRCLEGGCTKGAVD
jgi:hypothetical protein